ncbi:MAG: hypothetical protein GY740_22760 [Gammaproteobacteria bacterium]|jgi:RHS repeat-associated protein|nr:hypothetical protein [Gammaproteobacteria bacterium]PTB98981.1 hypothetical protein C9993_05340 [Marinobacter sp. Z-F4-2]|tara:strand:+ start:2432 stop:3322 length:891 start_codon:yes stop_codon:yes gene_type:complete
MTRTIWNTLAILAVLIFTALPLSAAEVVTYYHNDHLGSPIAATDSTGAVVWQQAYDPWGFKLTTNTDERGYTGNWLDEETGLADHKARWYTSSIGRFTGIDPVKWHETNIHSFNRYAYGNNNPYSYADPDGELAFPVVPILAVMAWEALGIGLEVATMEETSDSINRSGSGTFGVTGIKLLGSSMKMGLKGANVTKGTFQVGKSVGSAATRISVRGASHLAEGSKVTNIRKIADGRGIREVGRLVEQYGGKAKNWLKRSGDADVVTTSGNVRRAEVHWYEAHGVGKVEFKVKTWLD